MIVTTDCGPVRGTVEGGIARFLGIPYAAPPSGHNRFRSPQPHEPWATVFEADRMGATAPQPPYPVEVQKVLPSVKIPGAETLNLNIWTQADAVVGDTGLPVMVWVHGGGLTRGSNSLETYDGTAFARDGVVLVALNYRLGAEGFSVLDDAPRNLGLADVVAGLEWVRSNIRAFGGDPERVTVFGQSAGSALVAALLAHPNAPRWFSGAILQSGPIGADPAKKARRATAAVAKQLRVPATREAFAAVPPEELLEAQVRATEGSSPFDRKPAFGLAVDDDLIPEDPAAALGRGAGSSIPVMLGYTTEEYRLYLVPRGGIHRLNGFHLLLGRLLFKVPRKAVKVLRHNHPDATTGEIFGMLATDVMLRVPKNRVADARGGKTWMYEFAWQSPVDGFGAAHALELGFVFDTLATEESAAFAGPERPQHLADQMHSAWVHFAKQGDPGWQAWDATRPVMTFDHPRSEIVHAPRDDERLSLER